MNQEFEEIMQLDTAGEIVQRLQGMASVTSEDVARILSVLVSSEKYEMADDIFQQTEEGQIGAAKVTVSVAEEMMRRFAVEGPRVAGDFLEFISNNEYDGVKVTETIVNINLNSILDLIVKNEADGKVDLEEVIAVFDRLLLALTIYQMSANVAKKCADLAIRALKNLPAYMTMRSKEAVKESVDFNGLDVLESAFSYLTRSLNLLEPHGKLQMVDTSSVDAILRNLIFLLSDVPEAVSSKVKLFSDAMDYSKRYPSSRFLTTAALSHFFLSFSGLTSGKIRENRTNGVDGISNDGLKVMMSMFDAWKRGAYFTKMQKNDLGKLKLYGLEKSKFVMYNSIMKRDEPEVVIDEKKKSKVEKKFEGEKSDEITLEAKDVTVPFLTNPVLEIYIRCICEKKRKGRQEGGIVRQDGGIRRQEGGIGRQEGGITKEDLDGMGEIMRVMATMGYLNEEHSFDTIVEAVEEVYPGFLFLFVFPLLYRDMMVLIPRGLPVFEKNPIFNSFRYALDFIVPPMDAPTSPPSALSPDDGFSLQVDASLSFKFFDLDKLIITALGCMQRLISTRDDTTQFELAMKCVTNFVDYVVEAYGLNHDIRLVGGLPRVEWAQVLPPMLVLHTLLGFPERDLLRLVFFVRTNPAETLSPELTLRLADEAPVTLHELCHLLAVEVPNPFVCLGVEPVPPAYLVINRQVEDQLRPDELIHKVCHALSRPELELSPFFLNFINAVRSRKRPALQH